MNPLNLTGTAKPTYCTRGEAKVTNCAVYEWFTAEWVESLAKQHTIIYCLFRSLYLLSFLLQEAKHFLT